jgi:hypothetical protein
MPNSFVQSGLKMQRRPVWRAFRFAERLPAGLSRVAESFVTLKCDKRAALP